MTGEGQIQVAHGLIAHTLVGVADDPCAGHVLRLAILAGENQFPNLGHSLKRIGAGIAVGMTRPHGFFVQLDTLGARLAKHHGAQTSVTHRQSFHPLLRRLVIPQLQTLSVRLAKHHHGEGKE